MKLFDRTIMVDEGKSRKERRLKHYVLYRLREKSKGNLNLSGIVVFFFFFFFFFFWSGLDNHRSLYQWRIGNGGSGNSFPRGSIITRVWRGKLFPVIRSAMICWSLAFLFARNIDFPRLVSYSRCTLDSCRKKRETENAAKKKERKLTNAWISALK